MSAIPLSRPLETRSVPNLARDARFFLTMSIASGFAVFLGFSRTYFLRSYFGNQPLSLLLATHGAVFTAWILYFVVQTALVANRRVAVHRRLGYAGAVLASAMFVLGVIVSYFGAKYGFRQPLPFVRTPEAGFFFTLVDIVIFAVLVAAGFIFRHRRQYHQRFMLMSTVIALLPSALSRLPGPISPVLLIFLFVLAGPLYDLLTLRRIHMAYLWSLLIFFFALPPVRMIVGNSAAWYFLAHRLIT